MPFNLGFPELVLIVVAFLLLFGAKRLPEIAQGLGKGIREFKRAMRETGDEITTAANDKPADRPVEKKADTTH